MRKLPVHSTFKNVDAAVDRLLSMSGAPRLSNGMAIDVVRIAREFCRFDVAEVPDLNVGGSILGAFIPEFDLILLKANCVDGRKRFSLAHELGHAQLEHDFGSTDTLFRMQSTAYFRCEENDIDGTDSARRPKTEILANKFAAALLMPASTVRQAWRQERDVCGVARLLAVSVEAARIRLAELSLG